MYLRSLKWYKPLLLVLIISLFGNLQAQNLGGGADVVNYESAFKCTYKSVVVEEGVYDLVFTMKISKGFHIYSPNNKGYSIPLTINIDEDIKGVKLVGKIKESIKPHEHYDDLMESTELEHKGTVKFTQRVKLLKSKAYKLFGTVDFQICTEGKCSNQEADFEFVIDNKLSEEAVVVGDTAIQDSTEAVAVDVVEADTKAEYSLKEEKSKEGKSKEMWSFFILAFFGGIAAILTPCVFPMIPMTMSFFMKGSESKSKGRRSAITYGIFIILIYMVIGTVVSLSLGPDFGNVLSTHWVPNVIFFVVFMVFSASFFGAFEIVLPSWMVNKSSQAEGKSGMAGIFFMALTLVLVSFSCTAPIVGTILVASAGGEILKPIIGMLGFSLAFALPFTIFAFFPSLLQRLPKSGGWLNSVKVTLGFIEVALGFKFLSIADQCYHWGILDREVYLAIWIVCAILLGMYFLGKIQFKNDSPMKYLSFGRLSLAIFAFTFAVYMIPGMWGAPLKALSGYLPPMQSMDFVCASETHNINSEAIADDDSTKLCETAKYKDFLHLPHGLDGYFDLEQALRCAKAQNKPIFLDFTGHGCVNCREMEANVWSDPSVLAKLREEFIVVALYSDDKTRLPKEEWVKSEDAHDGKVKKHLGKKNIDYQSREFGLNAQPYYVLIDNEADVNDIIDKDLLAQPRGYNLDVEDFNKFLQTGIDNYKKRKK